MEASDVPSCASVLVCKDLTFTDTLKCAFPESSGHSRLRRVHSTKAEVVLLSQKAMVTVLTFSVSNTYKN